MGGIELFILLLIALFSFLLTYFLVKKWIKIGKELKFVGKDMNKYEKLEVVEAGGFYVIFSIIISLLLYISIKTYILGTIHNLLQIFVIITVLSLSTIIGILDDFLGWKKGIVHWKKVLITGILSLPLIITASGNTIINFPFLGTVNLGLLYIFLLIPIGIVGASNAFNMIAGYNGLETSMGIILFSFLGLKALQVGLLYISTICIIIVSSLISFLIFNKYPAKVFPGNTFTYGIGALYGSLVIIGNMEKFGVISYTLYFLELLLFLRGLKNGIYKENFGIPDKNNNLSEPYDKIYSITHFAIRLNRKLFKKATENRVVVTICILQLIISTIAFLI
ncbi:MAG: glycosyl transferase family 4 [Nanopusillaceae archaeon]